MLSSDKGSTIIELLVASVLATVVLGGVFSVTNSVHALYRTDTARLRVNQDLRRSLDFMGTYLKQAGERLPQGLLAIEIIDGTGTDADELIIRRNIHDEVLTICNDISASSSNPTIRLSNTSVGAPPACVYGGQATSFAEWNGYRTANGGTLKIYLYDVATQNGEFLSYTAENDTGSELNLSTTGSTTSSYTAENSAAYIIIEWHFRKKTLGPNTYLELIENEDTAGAQRIVFGVDDFQVRALMQDGSAQTTFGTGDTWRDLLSVEVTVSGSEKLKNKTLESTFTAEYYPRNILSL